MKYKKNMGCFWMGLCSGIVGFLYSFVFLTLDGYSTLALVFAILLGLLFYALGFLLLKYLESPNILENGLFGIPYSRMCGEKIPIE